MSTQLDFNTITLLVDEICNIIKLTDCCDRGKCPAYDKCYGAQYDYMHCDTDCAAVIRTWAYDTTRAKILSGILDEDRCHCLIDSRHGVYIPQIFAESVSWWGRWHLDNVEHKNILLEGPEHEDYWDTWDYVLNNAWFEDLDTGLTWTLLHDSDLFMVLEGYYTGEEE